MILKIVKGAFIILKNFRGQFIFLKIYWVHFENFGTFEDHYAKYEKF